MVSLRDERGNLLALSTYSPTCLPYLLSLLVELGFVPVRSIVPSQTALTETKEELVP